MAVVTICSDFGAQKIKSDTVSTVSPSIGLSLDRMVSTILTAFGIKSKHFDESEKGE